MNLFQISSIVPEVRRIPLRMKASQGNFLSLNSHSVLSTVKSHIAGQTIGFESSTVAVVCFPS